VTTSPPFTPPTHLSIVRRVLGTVIVALLVAAIIAYASGQILSDRVFFRHWFGNPVLGAVVVFALLLTGLLVLFPVRSEAAQHKRVVMRIMLIGLLAFSLIVFGFVQVLSVFTYSPTTVGRSPDGRWQAVLVNRGNSERRELHLIRGSGLGAIDTANLGSPCGLDVEVTFQGGDTVVVDTNYGQFRLRIDPTTGHPFNVIGQSCSPS
jgi:MFS family permease